MRFRPIHRITRSHQLILVHNLLPQLECNSIAGFLACGEYDRKLPQPEQEGKTSDLSVPGQPTIHAGSASVTLSRPNYYYIPLTTETETIGHHMPYVSSTTLPLHPMIPDPCRPDSPGKHCVQQLHQPTR